MTWLGWQSHDDTCNTADQQSMIAEADLSRAPGAFYLADFELYCAGSSSFLMPSHASTRAEHQDGRQLDQPGHVPAMLRSGGLHFCSKPRRLASERELCGHFVAYEEIGPAVGTISGLTEGRQSS